MQFVVDLLDQTLVDNPKNIQLSLSATSLTPPSITQLRPVGGYEFVKRARWSSHRNPFRTHMSGLPSQLYTDWPNGALPIMQVDLGHSTYDHGSI